MAEVCNLELWRAHRPRTAWSDSLVQLAAADEPQRMGGAPLRYPVSLRDAAVQGWVVLGLAISPDGRVAEAAVMASSNKAFEPPALEAALGSRFSLPRAAGKPVWAFRCVPVEFNIVR